MKTYRDMTNVNNRLVIIDTHARTRARTHAHRDYHVAYLQ